MYELTIDAIPEPVTPSAGKPHLPKMSAMLRKKLMTFIAIAEPMNTRVWPSPSNQLL